MRPHEVILIMLAVVAGLICGCDRENRDAILSDNDSSQDQKDRMNLCRNLAGTTWTWPEPDWPESKAWFHLKADGTALAGWHLVPCLWTATSGRTIRMIITSGDRKPKEVRFNGDFSEGDMRTVLNFLNKGPKEKISRIEKDKYKQFSVERSKMVEREVLNKISY